MNAAVDQHLAERAVLYGPTAQEQASALPEIGEGLSAQLYELHRDPTPERCERMASNLGGAQRAVLRLREALIREGTG